MSWHLDDTSVELWDRLFAVNARAPFLLMQAVAPKMKLAATCARVRYWSSRSFRRAARIISVGLRQRSGIESAAGRQLGGGSADRHGYPPAMAGTTTISAPSATGVAKPCWKRMSSSSR